MTRRGKYPSKCIFRRAAIAEGVSKSKKGCKDQESIQSSTTPDQGYQWESDTHS